MLAQENKRLRDQLDELKEHVKELGCINSKLRAKLILKEFDLDEKDQYLTRARRMIRQHVPVHIDLTKEDEEEMWIDLGSNKKRRSQQEMLQEQEERFEWYK